MQALLGGRMSDVLIFIVGLLFGILLCKVGVVPG